MVDGKLIVIEGSCEWIGKSTQFSRLKSHLQDDGYDVVSHHFPSTGEYQGILVEKYLNGEYGEVKNLSPYFVNSLYAVDRGVTWYAGLRKDYLDGKVILLDGYTTSSLVYQSALIDDMEDKRRFIDYVVEFEYKRIGLKKPDNVIFLYAPFEVALELRRLKNNSEGVNMDIHERDIAFMRRVHDSAMFVANYLGWEIVECNSGSNMRSIEDIHKDIYKLITKKNSV